MDGATPSLLSPDPRHSFGMASSMCFSHVKQKKNSLGMVYGIEFSICDNGTKA